VQDYSWATEPRLTVCPVDLIRSHPREVGRLAAQGFEPLSLPLQESLCFLPRPLPAPPSPVLARGRLQGLTPCAAPESGSGLSRCASCTDGGRVPLYTGGYHTCAGRPLKPTEPDPLPVWGLEPNGRSSSARVTMRNWEASLRLPIPVIPCSRSSLRLACSASTTCLRLHRCQ
jgi:hypothetical protein